MVPGLFGSGGSRVGGWYSEVFRGALDYREVHDVDTLREVMWRLAKADRASKQQRMAPNSFPLTPTADPDLAVASGFRARTAKAMNGWLERPIAKYVLVPLVVTVVAGVLIAIILR